MFSISWALEKGDYWKEKDQEIAKFFAYNWKKKCNDGIIRTGLYIGQLAIVLQKKNKKEMDQIL